MSVIKDFIGTFKRFKAAGLMNIFGLAVSFTAFSVIAIQLVFELGYDRCHENAGSIFRIESLYPPSLEYIASGAEPIGGLLKSNSPLVKDYFLISGSPEVVCRLGEEEGNSKFKEGFVQVMPSMIEMLGMEIVAGDGKRALTEPDMLMIPESMSRKWFGAKPALGKSVYIGEGAYTVVAVYKDFPENTIFKNKCYTRYVERENWSNWNDQLFVLSATEDKGQLQQSIAGVKMEVLDQIYEGLHKKEQVDKEGKSYVRASALTDIFYDNTVGYDTASKGNRKSSMVMLAVGMLIIVIAGINFINFSMSLAPTRMKEVNTRKVLGATTASLRRKLVGEAVLYALTAFIFSVVLLQLLSLTEMKDLFTSSSRPSEHLPIIACIGFLSVWIGIGAGIYPAFYMTSFEPASVLKGSFVMTPKGIRLRNSLMTFQFTVSITLIAGTLLMGAQNRFMQNHSPGFKTENIGWLRLDEAFGRNSETMMSELQALPEVLDYTFGNAIPGGDLISSRGTEIDGETVSFDEWLVYRNFLQFFDMQLVKGDTFSAYDQMKPQLIVNESVMKKFPVMERHFGRLLVNVDSSMFIGVVRDFNYLSLRNGINPLVIKCSPTSSYSILFLKLTGGDLNGTIGKIREIYERLAPEGIFEFKFLDETIQQNYQSEQRLAKLISLLGGIAIVLALVGVYGLVIFNAQYKRKEIGIRKVNGATEEQIIILLNRSFFRLLLLSFVIACPLAWYAISRWLEGFVYKTPIHWWIFLLAGVITLVISVMTVSWQSWRAATENPVKSLKSE